ncbi:cytochrome P450 [Aspergillus ellipticus CBS 707.79]|uniref:Cytochrome P450 n=1 Tax=Aspergillus ellipticus CBS 707.79 TaxID=1448320 RepID=A0A319DM31_9EURO|nr:cytochrome P450 [Aspergillus ellipticus CBS 707.79]
MDVHATLQAVAWAVALYWTGWIFYAKWLHPLAKFPGPPLAAVSRIWIALHVARGKAETEQKQLHAKYEAIKLPYLDACIKEGCRFHAIVGLTMPRHAPKQGCDVAGHWIPGGARIGVNPAVVHLDKSVFGDDAHTFRPERWLAPGANDMSQYIMQFGAGSRTCMGKHIYKVIPEMLRSFHLELEDPGAELNNTSYWFYKPDKVNVKFRRR